MNPRSAAAIEKLTSCPIFANVGTIRRRDVRAVYEWEDARAFCLDGAWEDRTLEEANTMTGVLRETHPREFSQWNSVVELLKSNTQPIVERRVKARLAELGQREDLLPAVSWDFLHIALNAHYEPLIGRTLYMDMFDWYLAGHFPCGWDADDEVLIVF